MKEGEANEKNVHVDRFDMPVVVGRVTWDVKVICPHCKKTLALNQFPYDSNETEYCPAEDELGLALFGRIDEPAKWSGFDIAYKCCWCKKQFTISSFEI